MEEVNEETGEHDYNIITPLEKTAWNNYKQDVAFTFTEAIIPYLIQLKSNFTQYLLADIGRLDNKYAITIYEWLSMHYNQYEHYQHKGNRTEKQGTIITIIVVVLVIYLIRRLLKR